MLSSQEAGVIPARSGHCVPIDIYVFAKRVVAKRHLVKVDAEVLVGESDTTT